VGDTQGRRHRCAYRFLLARPRWVCASVVCACEIDALAAYCLSLDKIYLLPISLVAGRRAVSLRLAPTKNNQRLGIHWAAKYELGAIAQLGERLHGMQEVAGSSPASSIDRHGVEQRPY
jgi:hypothetical protein